MAWFLSAIAVLLGVVLTTQIATNTQLGKALDNSYIPAATNNFIGLIATTMIAVWISKRVPMQEMVQAAPWYTWLAGGVLGAVYLVGNIVLAPSLGAAKLIGLVVVGQLVFSVVVDNFGLLGFQQHGAGAGRLIGSALMIAGVFLISRY